MKENEKKYNSIDFARYHSGEMPPDEMHALEKAALEDPFLADALEGYIHSKDHEKELSEIRIRLEEKRKQSKVFSISSLSSGAWWKIAAMFILFAGAGYFFYVTNSKKENSLVVKKNIPKKENPAIISPLKNDSAASEGNIAFEKTTTEKDKNDLAKLPSPVLKSVQPVVKHADNEDKIMKQEKIISEKQLTAKKENSMAMSTEKINAADINTDSSRQKSFFRSTDTTALVSVSPNLPFADSDKMVATSKQNATLNEVVVTGYGTQKRKDMTGPVTEALQGKVSGVQVNAKSPYPKDGMEKFDKYIKDHAIAVLDSNGNRIAANILLSFTLNKKGNPSHIKVVESSCKVCEEEAIRLLKDGPDWVGKKGEEGTVRIIF